MATHHDNCLREVSKHLAAIPANVPAHRKAARHVYAFSDGSFREQLGVWDHIWKNSGGFWVRVHATFFLERHLKKQEHLEAMWPVIVHWQDSVDDWGLCDALAKVYTKILVIAPDKVYRVLRQWNKDGDLWKRRQSVVSLLYYSRTKKDYLSFSEISALITPLLADKEYYVQKGVGWALREFRNVYPKEAHAYLTKHIRTISPIAFTIAIEKMGGTDKDKLKALRRPAAPGDGVTWSPSVSGASGGRVHRRVSDSHRPGGSRRRR
jgi:3-methyladenine DNA glycosylase AlkD